MNRVECIVKGIHDKVTSDQSAMEEHKTRLLKAIDLNKDKLGSRGKLVVFCYLCGLKEGATLGVTEILHRVCDGEGI